MGLRPAVAGTVSFQATGLLLGTGAADTVLLMDSQSCSQDHSLGTLTAFSHVSAAAQRQVYHNNLVKQSSVQQLVEPPSAQQFTADSPCSAVHAATATPSDSVSHHAASRSATQQAKVDEEDLANANEMHLPEVQQQPADAQGHVADAQGHVADAQGHMADAQGHLAAPPAGLLLADVHGSLVDQKSIAKNPLSDVLTSQDAFEQPAASSTAASGSTRCAQPIMDSSGQAASTLAHQLADNLGHKPHSMQTPVKARFRAPNSFDALKTRRSLQEDRCQQQPKYSH